jgi:hypothetical protein
VSIKSLRASYTPNDKWLDDYQKVFGQAVEFHPNYLCLKGDDNYLKLWFVSQNNPNWEEQKKKLFSLMEDIKKNGIQDHIKIYRDGRINTGHKRCCISLFLGNDLIRAEVVPDDYKL